ncbi:MULTISPECIES: TRAP transporter large permease subunit [unclassified Sulfitobacter]|uniref:TRAP transporter large permease subunit n=1 Tax=unclassified Sulfitobacter TaxID=196795 RepID=UPI0021595C1B|nr:MULTISPECIES: TRAP transporter large permease subunit [unclassified Sulfitobacter]
MCERCHGSLLKRRGGRLKGGAAKVSVLSSALFGSMSASANVASTGALTLPAMTKLGYPKRLAAAVDRPALRDASILLCASIIIGVLSITGLGVKITSLILEGSGGLLWPSLLLTALACLILGMEVPTTAAYVICVSVAGPALIGLGLSPLQAHLFVFWFALLWTITPPVCGAVFIAAGMIGENWLKVALTAMALGIGLYIIPLGMVANPDMLRLSDAPLAALLAAARVALGLTLLSSGLIGARRPIQTIALCAAGLIVVFSGL